MPSTVTAAAAPRDSFVFLIKNRTGYSNTSARKIPTNTIRKVSPIAANAASTPSVAATNSTVRIGRINSTRRVSSAFIASGTIAVAPDVLGVAVGAFTDPTFPPPGRRRTIWDSGETGLYSKLAFQAVPT